MGIFDVPPINWQEGNSEEIKKALDEYIEYFEKHLEPPYTYELPEEKVELGHENYYHYMCRGNAVQAVTGFMRMVQDDSAMFRLDPAQVKRLKEIENSLVEMGAKPGMRTKEEMQYLKDSIREVAELLAGQRNKLFKADPGQ